MYNSAIMRIDACYECSLGAITSELRRIKKLAPSSKKRGSKTEKAAQKIERPFSPAISLNRVHLELNSIDVNCLKHELFGRKAANEQTRTVGDIENAIGAIDELFTILEAPEIREKLTAAYKELPPA
jgi:hypothetical protein